jgi:hypothetical protein
MAPLKEKLERKLFGIPVKTYERPPGESGGGEVGRKPPFREITGTPAAAVL